MGSQFPFSGRRHKKITIFQKGISIYERDETVVEYVTFPTSINKEPYFGHFQLTFLLNW